MKSHRSYAFAVTILVFGGAFARTAILNWIAGPLIVVVSVAAQQTLSEWRLRRHHPVHLSADPPGQRFGRVQ